MLYRAIGGLAFILAIVGGAHSGSAATGGDDGEWPYKFVVKGPSAAVGGDQIVYRVWYTNVHPERPEGPGFVFSWTAEGASFASSNVISGPDGVISETSESSIRWDFGEAPPSGAVRVVLRVSGGFTGKFGAGIYVPGTGIHLPSGSVTSVSTTIRDEWPYRLVVTGPETAESGAQISYVVTFRKVHPYRDESPAFVFSWTGKAGRFIASKVLKGPAGTLTPQLEQNSVRWDFSSSPDFGRVRIGLKVRRGFTGVLGVGMYVPGTAIHLPRDSVTSVSTTITAP